MSPALVLDSSAVVEYLRATAVGEQVATAMSGTATSLHVPHLCAIEVASALRGLVSGKKLDATRAEAALSDLADLPATRHPAEPFLPRIWELRRNLTTYDAAYVTLAEALDATLITADRKLAPKYGHHARVQVVVDDG